MIKLLCHITKLLRQFNDLRPMLSGTVALHLYAPLSEVAPWVAIAPYYRQPSEHHSGLK